MARAFLNNSPNFNFRSNSNCAKIALLIARYYCNAVADFYAQDQQRSGILVQFVQQQLSNITIMSTFEYFPKEIWLNILDNLPTLAIDFLNPKHQHVRAVTVKWQNGAFKIAYPFLRMVSREFKQLMDDLKAKHFSSANPYKPLKGVDMCLAMAAEGRLISLKYLHENSAKWTEETCNYAALHGHLDCLIYAHEHGCKWGSETCALAASNGHIDCLKYAHENGCAWDTDCCTFAAEKGTFNWSYQYHIYHNILYIHRISKSLSL